MGTIKDKIMGNKEVKMANFRWKEKLITVFF